MTETESTIEEEVGFIGHDPVRKAELVQKIKEKKLRLSFSALRSFTSPRSFLDYKLGVFVANKDMIFGSLCHCLLLQEHKFDEEFAVVGKTPSAGNQTGFAKDYLAGMPVEDAFNNNYKVGTYQKVYDELKNYFDAKQSGKEIISQSVYDLAKQLTDYLKTTPLFKKYFLNIEDVEIKIEWTSNGFKFIGYIDGQLRGLKFDLKYMKDASPVAAEREITKKKYYMQAGMYDDGTPDQNDKYAIIAFDKKGNFCDIFIDRSYIEYGKREYKYLLHMLQVCAEEDRWDESYNFFDHSQRTLYKPKWLPGFATDPDNLD